MKALAKNIGKLNQYVAERFNTTVTKHELSQEFKTLESQTDIRKENVEEIVDSFNQYLKTLEKKKESSDKQKQLTIASFGDSLKNYGSDLPEDSEFGQALIKLGEVEGKLGEIQLEYASKFREQFLSKIDIYLNDLKQYKHLRGKLENRRLDYDSKFNRLQKAKKEKPELDEEMRSAQQKYQETLTELEQLMISLNECEPEQLEIFYNFLDIQQEFFTKSAQLLESAKEFIKDPSSRGNRLRKPRGSFGAGVLGTTPLNERVEMTVSEKALNEPSLKNRGSVSSGQSENKKLCRANYSFIAENEDEISLNKGDVVTVVEEIDPGWWVGELNGHKGLFPVTYCTVIDPVSSSAPSTYETLDERKELSLKDTSFVSSVSIPKSFNSGNESPLRAPAETTPSPQKSFRGFTPSCSQCGCSQFNENLFKKDQCNNCFHVHE